MKVLGVLGLLLLVALLGMLMGDAITGWNLPSANENDSSETMRTTQSTVTKTIPRCTFIVYSPGEQSLRHRRVELSPRPAARLRSSTPRSRKIFPLRLARPIEDN